MFDITPLKILIILLVALIVLGPERLPSLAHQVAKGWGDFRRFRDRVESEVRDTVAGAPSTKRPATNGSAAAPAVEGDGAGVETPGSSGEDQEQHHPGLN
ncbi:MAG TPA: twin-arginine translocase TatA/TatE family subunit [Acidimicrobiales bacterium]